MRLFTHRILAAVLMLSVLACGDDTGPPPVVNNLNNQNNVNNTNNTNNLNNSNNLNNTNNTNNVNNMEDMGDMGDVDMGTDMMPDMPDEMCPSTPCMSDEICVDGACLPADSCQSAFDFGTLASGSTVSRSGSFVTEGSDTIGTTCAGAMASRERVFRFELTEDSIVTYTADWNGQFDGVLEFRTDCQNAVGIERCTDAESGTIELDAGVYFLILEVKFGNPGDFSIELTSTASTCQIGTRECLGDAVAQCIDGVMRETYACAGGCTNGVCDGDSCSMPVTIAANGGVYSGDARGQSNNYNFAGNVSCLSVATPGYEIVFYLPGLVENQVVTIDAETGDINSNAIFVQSACGDTEMCLAAFDNSEDVDFVVPSDGDYFVIIDKILNSPAAFNYSVTVN